MRQNVALREWHMSTLPLGVANESNGPVVHQEVEEEGEINHISGSLSGHRSDPRSDLMFFRQITLTSGHRHEKQVKRSKQARRRMPRKVTSSSTCRQ